MKDVIENNKLIAEFMMFETVGDLHLIPFDNTDNDTYLPEHMKFHSSWDWLMPVVKEIRETINVKLTVDDYDTKKDYNQRLNPYEYNIDSIYKGAIEFIKWWNSAVENERDMASDMDREPYY